MKFLRTFNPRIDADAFIEALEQNWEWNVILIKRHRIKLVLPLFFVCVSLWLLALMLYIIYVNIFESNKMIYRALATFYLFTSLSWTWFTIYLIFSETVCQINSKKKYYDSVEEMEPKQRIFSLFLKRSFIVFIVHLLFLIFNWSVPFVSENLIWYSNLDTPFLILFIDFLFLMDVIMVLYWLIDYEMNFCICTKDAFELFMQKWILYSDTLAIANSSISIIKFSKSWLMWAMFKYWTLFFYTDSWIDADWAKNIEIQYIPDPKHLAKKLNSLMWK